MTDVRRVRAWHGMERHRGGGATQSMDGSRSAVVVRRRCRG
jgi:hypothetical protein